MTSRNDQAPDSVAKTRALTMLADEILKERLTVFFGAGCSTTAGLPSWGSLVEKLQVLAGVKSQESNLFFRLTKLEKKWGRLKLRERIAESLRIPPKINSPLHERLIALDVNLYITTNYDHLLENVFRDQGYDPMLFFDPKDIPSIDPTRKTIVKLHGDIDSPSSLVLTKTDYRKYSTDKRGFVEWLNSILTQNTLLFLGTSFEDPRLLEADNYVLDLFDISRRSPFIILRRPQEKDCESNEDYEIKLDDFEEKCRDFVDRGFFVIPIDSYEELPGFLQQLQEVTSRLRLRQRETFMVWSDTTIATHLERHERRLGEHIRNEIKRLCELLLGAGRLPTIGVIRKRAKKLLDYLRANNEELTPTDRLEAYLSLTDAYCVSNHLEDIQDARRYFGQAISAYEECNKSADWQERVLRIEAKLLFNEGEIATAIHKLIESTDPKTIGFRLALQLDSGNIEDAFTFVQAQKEFHPDWTCQAICVLIGKGRIDDAERHYHRTIEEYRKAESKGELENTDFGGDYFYEKLHVLMADAFWQRALKSTGWKAGRMIYPGELSEEVKVYCRKSLHYIDLLWQKVSIDDRSEAFLHATALSIEMHAAFYLGDFERADAAAHSSIHIRPIRRNTAEYVIRRSSNFDEEILRSLKVELVEDYPERIWSLIAAAQIHWQVFGEKEGAWALISKAISFIATSHDRRIVAYAALQYGLEIGQLDSIFPQIRSILDPEEDLQKVFNTIYEFIINQPSKNDPQEEVKRKQQEKAVELLAEYDDNLIDNELQQLKMLCRLLRAEFALEQGDFSKSKELAVAANSVALNSFSMQLLLKISVKEQNYFEVYEVIQQLESYGIAKEPEMHLKAQAASNLGRFEEATQIYQSLIEKHPNQSIYALELAKLDFQQGKPADSILNVLHHFIKGRGETDLNCLFFACVIYESEENSNLAFSLLEENFEQFCEVPEFLAKYLDLAFRTGKEDEANKAFIQLEKLRKEGKKVDHVFALKHVDELKQWIRQHQEESKEFYQKYVSGRIPRLLLCKYLGRSLYLDWAIRTQPLSLSMDVQQWNEYTTYTTNSFRVGFKEGRNQLVHIAPAEQLDEIVIDYHAIISLHRLNLIDILTKRYQKVYFPRSLLLLLQDDQRKFSHHQKSKENAYKKIHEFISQSRIDVWEAPPLESKSSADSLLKRNLRLAKVKEAAYIDAFAREREIEGFVDIPIIRLDQIIDWLYATGGIGENRRRELKGEGDRKGLFLGEPGRCKEYRSFLTPGKRLVIEEYTLELFDQYQLIEILIDRGLSLLVEKATADDISFKNSNIHFIRAVGDWNKELTRILKTPGVFIPISPQKPTPPEVEASLDSLEKKTWFESVQVAEEIGLPLLTDDRFTQMLPIGKRNDRQFGTDALLKHLFTEGLLGMEEYSEKFLQLCKWRYRFLLPELSVLQYLVQQYQQYPPGEPLQQVSKYCRDCMRDVGLFYGQEPTEPPLPLAVKLYMSWRERWFELLATIWLADYFHRDSLERLTHFVLTMAVPDPPHGLRQDIRDNLTSEPHKDVMLQLFVTATQTEQPEKLHGLFKQIFRFYSFDREKRLLALRYILNWIIEETEQDEYKATRKLLFGHIIRAYYGKLENYPVEPQLHDLYERAGIKMDGENEFEDDFGSGGIDSEKIPQNIRDLANLERALPNYEPHGVLMYVPRHEEKKTEVLVPHDLVLAPSASIRMQAIKAILSSEHVTSPSKHIIKTKELALNDGNASTWRRAAADISEILLKDFAYVRSLFREAWDLQTPQHTWMDMAWKGLLHPNLDTVLAEVPRYVHPSTLKASGLEGIHKELIQELDGVNNQQMPVKNRLLKSMDWYLENLGFIPLGPPFDAWNVIEGIFLEGDRVLAQQEEFLTIVPKTIREWLDSNKDDSIAYIIGLQLLLKARYEVYNLESSTVRSEYEDEDFKDLLEKIFDVLLKGEARIKGKSRSELLEKCHVIWSVRSMIAKYYLQFIDLEIGSEWGEDQKIRICWWVAREIAAMLVKYSSPLSHSEQSKWLSTEAMENINKVVSDIPLIHTLSQPIAPQGLSRFATFTEKYLPARAALAVLQPQVRGDLPATDCVQGLKYPNRILSQDTTDALFEHLMLELPLGHSQALFPSHSEDSISLWDVPFSISIPALIRDYYADNVNYLGKASLELIQFAEYSTKPDFLSKECLLFQKYFEEKKPDIVIVTVLASLDVHLTTKGVLPDSANKLTEMDSLLDDLKKALDSTLFPLSILIIVTLLHKLLLLDIHRDISRYLVSQLSDLDLDSFSDENIWATVAGLLTAVMFGADFELAKRVKNYGKKHEKVRDHLNQFYDMLYRMIPKIPGRFRENARQLLDELRIFSENPKEAD